MPERKPGITRLTDAINTIIDDATTRGPANPAGITYAATALARVATPTRQQPMNAFVSAST